MMLRHAEKNQSQSARSPFDIVWQVNELHYSANSLSSQNKSEI